MSSPLRYLLDLGDGGPPIPCRDKHQASLLAGIWRAAHLVYGRPLTLQSFDASDMRKGDASEDLGS